MEGEGEGPTRFVCWMRATELKIVRERERERERDGGRGRERGRERIQPQNPKNHPTVSHG